MRYFRMYLLVNVVIVGVMHAAEAPQDSVSDSSASNVDEEPPQEIEEQKKDEPSDVIEAKEEVPIAQEISPVISDNTVKNETEKSEEVVQQKSEEPTLEDAEKLIEAPANLANNELEESVSKEILAEVTSSQASSTVLPAEPPAHTVEQVSQKETVEEGVRGIDTVNLEQPQGNWLFKRYWWERAEEIYKKIRTHAEKINDFRVKFFARRTELDKSILDPFYLDIGLTQSELQASMQSLMAQLERERTQEGMLSEEERELMDTVQKDRERLEQLQRDVRAVGAMRDAADKAIDRVIDQKKRVSVYEADAWESMRQIGRIVSDTQASELYYRIDAGWRTVKDIYRHIDQDLNRYFDTLLSNAKEQTERIKTALQALKEQGLDLKARMQQIQEQEMEQEKAVEDTEKDKKTTVPEKKGWFASTSRLFQAVIDVAIWQFLQSIWDVLMWLPRRIYSTITSLFR